jgi:hypothetical protein
MEVGLCEKIAWSSRRKATFDNLHVMRHEAVLENNDEACSEPAASSENVAKGSSKGIGE